MDYIINATPMSYNRGIHDVSGTEPVIAPEARPTHLPKSYLYAQKGKGEHAYLVDAAARDAIFGVDSFDPLQKWCNHSTPFIIGMSAFGNQILERIIPADAKRSTLRLSIDLLPATLPVYERNSDGSFKLDADGDKIETSATVSGFKGKFVVETIGVDVDGASLFGQGAITAGDQTANSTQSQRIPLIDWNTNSEGSWGDNAGIRLWSTDVNASLPIDVRLVEDQKAYPFFIATALRADSISSSSIKATLGGSQFIPFVLKPGLVDRQVGAQRYLGDVFVKAWTDTSTVGMPPTYGAFDEIHVYDSHIADVLQDLYDAEYAHPTTGSDFDGTDDEVYRYNLFGATTSTGVPYNTFEVVTGASNSARLASTSTLYATGGNDGTMNDAAFAAAVKVKLQEYSDPNSKVQVAATNVESIFYDSGYPVDTKKAFANLISVRKDILAAVSTYVSGGAVLTDDDERSLAIMLLTLFQTHPESSYYGTPATRAMIIGGSAYVLNSTYSKPVPFAYELAVKSARAMGAGNGQWKKEQMFDAYPGSLVQFVRDVSLPFRPANARFKDWDAQLVWAEPFDRSRFYTPALQTINPDDTSVLNNYFMVMACIELTKIGEAVHKRFSGTTELTADQLAARVDEEITNATKDVFASRYIITPKTTTTADDSLRGYSWTTVIGCAGNVAKTVQTLTIESQRIENVTSAT